MASDGNRKVDLSDKWWRLTNLYWIVDESGTVVRFAPNVTQERLFEQLHYLNVILKARQLGCTTFIDIFMLDECLFNSNVSAGIIAHNLEDVKKIFQKKIKFPYEHMPDSIRERKRLVTDSKTGLDIENNSSIYVGTSMRSGTLQYLHISEHGKICAKWPDKAEELRTGALNTVHSGQVVFDESTAEGPFGDFYELCNEAKARTEDGRPLSPMEFKFHFFPWWIDSRYVHPPEGVRIPEHLDKYFASLGKRGVCLSDEQRAWYALKYQTQKGKMKQEYPSTPEEAFELSLEGVIYEEELTVAREEGRIGGAVEHDPSLPVHTFWDLGMDATGILFAQDGPAGISLVDYWEMPNAGLGPAAKELERKEKKHGYRYGLFVGPHDIENRDWTQNGKSRKDVALEEHGLVFRTAKRPATKDSGIETVKTLFPRLWISEKDCIEREDTTNNGFMLKCLSSYRRKVEEKLGVLSVNPLHDWACHCADALQTLAIWHEQHGKLDETGGFFAW